MTAARDLDDVAHGDASAREALHALLSQDARRIGLPAAAVDIFARKAQLSFWRRGQTILPRIGGHEAVHLLVAGAAKLIVCTSKGTRPLTLGLIRPGRFLGVSSLFDPPRPRLFRGRALLDCCVAALSHEDVAEIVAQLPPGAAYEMLAHSWRILSSVLHRKCRSLSAPLHDRLLAELQSLANDFGAAHPRGCLIDLELSCTDLAELTATSELRVARMLARLQHEGLVELDGPNLVLSSSADAEAIGGRPH